jgi:hypothetical protein
MRKRRSTMKIDLWTKVALWTIAVLLFLNFFQKVFTSQPALALRSNTVGKYQISSWAAHGGATTAHSGYYVVDTTTGKVVGRKAEVRTREEWE